MEKNLSQAINELPTPQKVSVWSYIVAISFLAAVVHFLYTAQFQELKQELKQEQEDRKSDKEDFNKREGQWSKKEVQWGIEKDSLKQAIYEVKIQAYQDRLVVNKKLKTSINTQKKILK